MTLSKYGNIPEEELKNNVARDWFTGYDTARILGDIDFSVYDRPRSSESLFDPSTCYLWAESKKGTSHDIYESLIQLIITIGKARTFDNNLPPEFLGAFDARQIGFVPYGEIMHVFSMNDFNWTITPSNHDTKEFKYLLNLLKDNLKSAIHIFDYSLDATELKKFISKNFVSGGKEVRKIFVNKNNFTYVYNKWVVAVKPSINIDWELAKSKGLLDCDFFLADLISKNGESIKKELNVVLKEDHYETDKKIGAIGITSTHVDFQDKQRAYRLFWNNYERPPHKKYWDFILQRRDLLVPQDVRERKGSFFTPRIWVEKSQEYLSKALGEEWQEDYYIWDCCSGTGNLEFGLINKYNVWMSTIDKSDVDVILDYINNNRFNMLPKHVFQFDFLNDDFISLPDSLKEVINDPEKRRRLIIYINPPYAETATDKPRDKARKNKRGVSFTKTRDKYSKDIGIATKELFAQFLYRIYREIPGCIIANFSTLKHIQGINFDKFRAHFTPRYYNGFIVPADTFDNVKGQFPIAFMIWNTSDREPISEHPCDIYNRSGELIGHKMVVSYDDRQTITDWFRHYHNRTESSENIGAIGLYGSDFQHAKYIYITNPEDHPNRWTFITKDNLIEACMYMAIRRCVAPTWINDRDQFLSPTENWKRDISFQYDCLIWALFNNNIKNNGKPNHWIPYSEADVNAPDTFSSHFMFDYLSGANKRAPHKMDAPTLFDEIDLKELNDEVPLNSLSQEAMRVYESGRRIWQYYMSCEGINCNASFYDIKAYFQGFHTNKKGDQIMNNDSDDEIYMNLRKDLNRNLKALTQKIAEKVYLYGFLIE